MPVFDLARNPAQVFVVLNRSAHFEDVSGQRYCSAFAKRSFSRSTSRFKSESVAGINLKYSILDVNDVIGVRGEFAVSHRDGKSPDR